MKAKRRNFLTVIIPLVTLVVVEQNKSKYPEDLTTFWIPSFNSPDSKSCSATEEKRNKVILFVLYSVGIPDQHRHQIISMMSNEFM